MARKTTPRPAKTMNGIVVLSQSDLDDATAAGLGIAGQTVKSVDGLSTEIKGTQFQDGDDLFLRKRPGRS